MIRVAVAMGGFSPEREISLMSGKAVAESLDRSRFEVYALDVSREAWHVIDDGEAFEFDRSRGVWTDSSGKENAIDVVFNAIHGSPGEDGPLQGYLDLMGIPYTGSGQFEMGLTFSKSQCNSVLRDYGLPVSPSILVYRNRIPSEASVGDTLGWPVFVKPNRSGSSFGVSKVKGPEAWEAALNYAFEHGDQVVVERYVPGMELGCGITDHRGTPELLGITEIVPDHEFFDYASKYEGASQEITPAPIEAALAERLKSIALEAYTRLNLKGIARVDFIVHPEEGPFIIEINAVPGLGPESIVPKQIRASGLDAGALFGALIERSLHNRTA